MKRARWQVTSGLALIAVLAITIAWLWRRHAEPEAQLNFIKAYLTISSSGDVRNALLCTPTVEPTEPIPLVIAFHGVGDTPEKMFEYSHLAELMDEGRCYVVFVAARHGKWETETSEADGAKENRDVQFFDDLLEYLTGRIFIDFQRIYVVGMSDGATFVEILSLARPCEVAATVAVAGGLPPNLPLESKETRHVPMLLIAGADDETGTAEAIRKTAEQLQQRGHEIEVQILDGVKHEWPADENDAMWEFLSGKSVPEDCGKANAIDGNSKPIK